MSRSAINMKTRPLRSVAAGSCTGRAEIFSASHKTLRFKRLSPASAPAVTFPPPDPLGTPPDGLPSKAYEA